MDRSRPVVPAQIGTFSFPDDIRAKYTVGRGPAIEAVRRIRASFPSLAVDIETYGLGRDALDIKCVQIGTADHAVVLDPRDEVQAAEIRATFREAQELVFHNSAYDVPSLTHNKLMSIDDIAKVTDTLIYARLAEPDETTSKGLLAAGARYLGTEATDALVPAFKALSLSKTEGYRIMDINVPLYVRGAAIDVIVTARLLPRVREAAMTTLTDHPFTAAGVRGEETMALREREQRINRIILKRAAKGLRVDLDYLQEYRDSTGQQVAAIRNELESAGIKPGHGGQLTDYLERVSGLPQGYPRTATGKWSATASNLEMLQHPIAKRFVELKKIEKIDKDYLQKTADMAEVDGRIHPVANILGATTGRMSMGNPPLQQFNGPARGIVLADPGETLVSIDWSQIEPVVAANIAKQTDVVLAYENPDVKADMYQPIADLAGVSRKQAKVMLLAQMYGQGLTRLAASMGITPDQAYEIRNAIFRNIPEVAGLIRKLKIMANTHGRVFTLSGRIIPVPSFNGEVAAYKGVNYFVQGSAYDVLADTVIRVEEAGLADALYLLMHDEIVCEESAAHDIQRIMATPPERLCFMSGRTPVLRTDLKVLGPRWDEA